MSETLTFDDICAVFVNYRTPDLLEKAVTSFRGFYPEIDAVIVDNGSKDESLDVIKRLRDSAPTKVRPDLLDRNYFHGPAMDRVMRSSEKKAVFFLDTDTETYRGGFIEKMLDEMNRGEDVYGVGRIGTVNKRGFPAQDGTKILISAYMMLRTRIYPKLLPFVHHGMPTLDNFGDAVAKGYRLIGLDMDSYIHHRGRGTASRFGYGLGLRGKIDYALNKVGL